jgi:hypothetical protein
MTLRVISSAEIDAQNKLIAALNADNELRSLATPVTQTTDSDKKDDLMNALLKYIPVTIVVGYTFLDSVFRAVTPVPETVWMASFVALLILAFILTYQITAGSEIPIAAMLEGKESVQKAIADWQAIIRNQRIKQSVIAVIAFAGYVMCLGGPFTSLSWWQAYYGSVALVFATVLIAIIAAKDLLAS